VSLLYAVKFLEVPHFGWNGARLAFTRSLFEGYRLYYPMDEGPVLNMLYGPVPMILWSPSMWAPSLTGQLVCAALITALAAVVPFAFLCLRTAGPDRHDRLLGIAAFVLVAGCLPLFKSTGYIATRVHVDAFCLGFMLLSSVLLLNLRGKPLARWKIPAAALLAALAVWSKQTVAPLVLVQIAYLGVVYDRRRMLHYAAICVAAGAVIGLFVVACLSSDGLGSVFFRMFRTTTAIPLKPDGVGEAIRRLISDHLVLWLALLLLVPVFLRGGSRGSARDWLAGNPWLFFLLLALVSLPTSLLAFAKVGGWVNSFHTVYFVVAAIAVGLIRHDAAALREPAGGVRCLLLLFAVASAALPAEIDFDRIRNGRDLNRNPHEQAHRFVRAHPGQVYLPTYPLVALAAERRVQPFYFGVFKRFLTGHPIKQKHLDEYLPEKLRYLAIHPNDFPDGLMDPKRIPRGAQRLHVAGMEDWLIFAADRRFVAEDFYSEWLER
jgi:hypothetical protein